MTEVYGLAPAYSPEVRDAAKAVSAFEPWIPGQTEAADNSSSGIRHTGR